MGTLDPAGAYWLRIGLGCELLGGAWPGPLVEGLSGRDFYNAALRGCDTTPPPFPVSPVDVTWINAWKFWTAWGWLGYGGVAVLWMMSGGNAVLEFVDWALVIWPCIIFTVVALLARWRVSWPILLVNLRMLVGIVLWVVKWALIFCGLAWVVHGIWSAFEKSRNV